MKYIKVRACDDPVCQFPINIDKNGIKDFPCPISGCKGKIDYEKKEQQWPEEYHNRFISRIKSDTFEGRGIWADFKNKFRENRTFKI